MPGLVIGPAGGGACGGDTGRNDGLIDRSVRKIADRMAFAHMGQKRLCRI